MKITKKILERIIREEARSLLIEKESREGISVPAGSQKAKVAANMVHQLSPGPDRGGRGGAPVPEYTRVESATLDSVAVAIEQIDQTVEVIIDMIKEVFKLASQNQALLKAAGETELPNYERVEE